MNIEERFNFVPEKDITVFELVSILSMLDLSIKVQTLDYSLERPFKERLTP